MRRLGGIKVLSLGRNSGLRLVNRPTPRISARCCDQMKRIDEAKAQTYVLARQRLFR